MLQITGANKRQRSQALMEGMLGLMRFDTPVNENSDIKALAQAQYEAFCKKFAAEKAFIAYFRSQWGSKLGRVQLCLMKSTLKSQLTLVALPVMSANSKERFLQSLKASFLSQSASCRFSGLRQDVPSIQQHT